MIITYYFPPLGMGGVQRTTKFVKYLPTFGWKPYVLTVREVEYMAKDPSLLDEVPQTQITRTGSFDPLRTLFVLKSVFERGGKHGTLARPPKKLGLLSGLFFPDNKVGWVPFALRKGLSLCRREKIDLIFSSSPPPSAHLAACMISRATEIPWVADFRDPWVGYKLETLPTRLHLILKRGLEKRIVANAKRVVAANPVIQDELERINPQRDKLCLIDQGYDEQDFRDYRSSTADKFTVGYLGTFSSDCDPKPAFRALGELISRNLIPKEEMRFLHVGASLHLDVGRLAKEHGLGEVLETKGYLSHREAIRQMGEVSLLLLVTSGDPRVFPAKVFEYLRLGKPILCIAPEKSKLAEFLREMKAPAVVSPGDGEGIKQAFISSFADFRNGKSTDREKDDLKRFERRTLTSRLASLFDEVTSE